MHDTDIIRVACPKCQKKLRVTARSAGKRVRCPVQTCATLIHVPAASHDMEATQQHPTAAARWPWLAGGAAALLLAIVTAVGLGIWALNRGAQQAPAPNQPAPALLPAVEPVVVAKTDAQTDDGASVTKTPSAFKPGDWFLWQHSLDGGKTSLTTKHTITSADDKSIFYEVERSASAGKNIKKNAGQFAVHQLGKSPIADGDAKNEILGKGKETLRVAGKNIACDWVEYKSSEAGDPMKYKINEVAYGETIITTAKVWYSAQVPALVVKNEARTSYIVPPQVLAVFRKQVPADVSSIYQLIDLGSNASVALNTAKSDPPKIVSQTNPPLALLAGEWAEQTLGHYLHLDADGFGYGQVRLFSVHTVEMRIRQAEGHLILDFPDEVSFGPGRRELRSKPMTLRLADAGTLELSDVSGKLWYRLTKSTVTREPPKLSDFAGDWKVWSVTADGPPGVKDGFARVLKLKNLKLALGADGTGTAQFGRDDKPDGPPARLSFKQADDGCVLDGLDGQAWEVKFFYIGDKARMIRLRTKDGATRLYTQARLISGEKLSDAKMPTAITTKDLLGIWEGTSKDDTTIELMFKDTLVVVSILGAGINRQKAREAAEWASGNLGRALGGGGFSIGTMEYEIDAEKNEVGILGAVSGPALVKPTKDGALLVSGSFKISGATVTVPETRVQRAKPNELPEKAPKQEEAKEPMPKKGDAPTLPSDVGSLPKAKGPRLKELAKAPTNVALDAIYLAGPFMRDKRAREWPQAFPAGTDETCIVVVLRSAPFGTQVVAEVASAAGPVRLAPSTVRTIQSAAETVIELTCAPAGGAYADGDYVTKVLINRTAVAELHWCVGGKEPATKVIALAGTVWHSRYGDGSGYELRFGDGGKLDVHALPGAGKSTWQVKKGTWQQNGADVSGFADQDGPQRRRVEFRGKLIDGELGVRIRNENEDGPAGSFGNRYEIPRAKKK